MKKVSIVIPIYNVDRYLNQCIESIVNQTYRNIEIILVNDGSDDESGKICNEWEKRDARVKVLHQKNQGCSMARNNGMKVMTGEYFVFVDGDDVIVPNMIEKLVDKMESEKVESVFCKSQIIQEKESEMPRNKIHSKMIILNSVEAELKLINHEECDAVWNGIYLTNLLRNLQFPIGRKNEDVFWKYLAISKCKNIGYIEDELYVYRVRGGSLTHVKFSNKDFDALDGVVERTQYIVQYYPQIKYPAITDLIAECMRYYMYIQKNFNGEEKKEALIKLKGYRKKYKINIIKIFKEKNISKSRKYSIILARISFPIACYIKEIILNKVYLKENKNIY